MAPKAWVPASTSAAWRFDARGASRSPWSRYIMPEARDRAVDEVGLDRCHRGVAQAELLDDAGGEVLDEHVGHAAEVGDHPAALRVAQVDRHALLARVDADEVGGLVGAPRLDLEVVLAHVVAVAGPLDLDDPRAQVREQAGAVGAGQDAGEIEDHEVGEGPGGVAHRPSIARRLTGRTCPPRLGACDAIDSGSGCERASPRWAHTSTPRGRRWWSWPATRAASTTWSSWASTRPTTSSRWRTSRGR